jgi:methyl-accepting chemotaxis protein
MELTTRTRSLRSRAIGILLGAVLVAAALALLASQIFFGDVSEKEVRKRGQSLVTTLAQHQKLRLALSLQDRAGATAVASEVRAGDDDIRDVVLLDGKDVVLAAASSSEATVLSDGQVRAIASGSGTDVGDVHFAVQEVKQQTTAAKGGDLDFAAGGETEAATLGKVIVGLSSRAAKRRLAAQTAITIGATALVLVLAFLVFFSSIVARLNRMSQFAQRVTRGELGAQLVADGADEIGALMGLLAEMTRRMGSMVGRMQDASLTLTTVSTEILASSTQQGQSASRQATSVAQTGATVAQLRETFAQTSERAQAVIDLAKKSEESSNSGRAAVQESVAAMEQMRDQVTAISRTILGLVERTNQIGSIIDAVNDLAEQSNVLALNAAIEAAKAGEHGRGFAVVAREVRNLAERSKDSTGQVRTILGAIDKATRDALAAIDEGTRKAQVGMELATRAGQSITLLDGAIDQSSGAAKQIAASLRQQSVGVEQIWEAMREIDRAVKSNVEGIQQLETASCNMKGASDQMSQLVTSYTTPRA